MYRRQMHWARKILHNNLVIMISTHFVETSPSSRNKNIAFL